MAETVSENEENFNIQTDKVIQARRPDVVLVKKKDKKYLLIDDANPDDSWVWSKEDEKVDKNNDIAWELKRIWKVKTYAIPL